MATYIKTGYWEKQCKPCDKYRGWLNLDELIASISGTGGGLQNITYSELYTKVTTGTLTPGAWYRLIDYSSVNFLNGWRTANNNPTPNYASFDPREVYTGKYEVLILQATSPYEISEIGYSETFNGDIVQYEPYTNKIGVDLDIYNGQTLPDSSTVSGFDLQWDGTNVYFNMPADYPALFGHYFYLYCEFYNPTLGRATSYSLVSGVAAGSVYTQYNNISTTTLTGIGEGLKISLADNGDTTYSLYGYDDAGKNYAIGDTVLILGSQVGGVDGINDITITIDNTDNWYYQDGDYEPLTPGESVCQYPYTSDDTEYGYPKAMSRLKVVDDGMKVIMLDLTYNDYLNYQPDSLYIDTVYALGDAYGCITRRIDTLRNIDVPFDFRGRKYRRYEVDAFGKIESVNYTSSGAAFVDGVYYITVPIVASGSAGNGLIVKVRVNLGLVVSMEIIDGGAGYDNTTILTIPGYFIPGGVSPADDITINVTGTFSQIGYYSIGDSFYNSIYGYGKPTFPNFKDFKSFGNGGYDVYDIKWEGMGGPDMYWYRGYTDNNVFYDGSFYNNKLKDFSNNNTFRNTVTENNFNENVSQNICTGSFFGNTLNIGFFSNIINSFTYNNIGIYFSYNSIKYFDNNTTGYGFSINKIQDSFNYNNVGANFYYNSIGDCYNNTIKDNFQYNLINDSFNGNSIRSYFTSNYIGISFNNNTIGDFFNSNRIDNYFFNNSIGNFFQQNNIKNNFAYNHILNSFQYNTIDNGFGYGYNTSQGNNIGNYFQANNIKEYFYNNTVGDNFTSNTIKDYFKNNVIGSDMNQNNIKDGFSNNRIAQNFYQNVIGDSFRFNDVKTNINNTDFTLATHVYGVYNCDLFRKPDNSLGLSYISNAGTLIVTGIGS